MELYKDGQGIIRLYDGTIVYVIEVRYSADGMTFWESTYNANPHVYEGDGVTKVDGHRYMQIRHAGDTYFQKPMYITAVDGKSPELKVEGNYIVWGYADDADSWKQLIAIENLKGETGDQGPQGEGLYVDTHGFYGEFSITRPSGGCVPCNRGGDTATGSMALSYGDGLLPVTALNISNNQFRSTDGLTWVALGANDLDRLVRFIADDAIGTNYIDYRTTNTLNTKGKVYGFVDDAWIELNNLAVPNYLVAATSGNPTNGKFLEDFASTTVGLDVEENLEVKDDSLAVVKADTSFAGHGLDKGATLAVNPDEIVGHGVKTYVATSDSEKHIEVNTSEIISDGLAFEAGIPVDGEDHDLIRVDADQLVNSISGLETTTELDGYKDFKVKAGDAIEVNADGVNVKADETSLAADTFATIRVNPTDNNAKGIQALHLHNNTANNSKGLQKGQSVLDPLEVKVDAISIGFNGTGNVEIPDHGVHGVKLNADTIDATKGLVYSADKISVNLAAAGGLQFDGTGAIELDTSTFLTGRAVKSLNGLVNDLTLSADDSGATGSGITLDVNEVASDIGYELAVDENTLKTYLGIAGGGFAPAVHTHTIDQVTGLQAELDAKITLDTPYGTDFRITAANGVELRYPGNGAWFRLIISNAAGDLETTEI